MTVFARFQGKHRFWKSLAKSGQAVVTCLVALSFVTPVTPAFAASYESQSRNHRSFMTKVDRLSRADLTSKKSLRDVKNLIAKANPRQQAANFVAHLAKSAASVSRFKAAVEDLAKREGKQNLANRLRKDKSGASVRAIPGYAEAEKAARRAMKQDIQRLKKLSASLNKASKELKAKKPNERRSDNAEPTSFARFATMVDGWAFNMERIVAEFALIKPAHASITFLLFVLVVAVFLIIIVAAPPNPYDTALIECYDKAVAKYESCFDDAEFLWQEAACYGQYSLAMASCRFLRQ